MVNKYKCKECKNEFKLSKFHPNQEFCKKKCRDRFKARKYDRPGTFKNICIVCGEKFTPGKCQPYQQYCYEPNCQRERQNRNLRKWGVRERIKNPPKQTQKKWNKRETELFKKIFPDYQDKKVCQILKEKLGIIRNVHSIRQKAVHLGLKKKNPNNRGVERPFEVVKKMREATKDPKIKKNRERAGRKGYQNKIDKSPYIWKGVKFHKKEEMIFAQKLFGDAIPQKGVDFQVKVESKLFDFFPEQKLFIEYHAPYWSKLKGQTKEDYIKQREKAIQSSQFKNTPLIVIFDSITKRPAKISKQLEEIKTQFNLFKK